MLILAVRYSFLFWLSISESLLIPIMESDDLQIYRVSACTARCLLEQKQLNVQQEQQQLRSQQLQWVNQTNLESCYHFCRKQNDKSIHLKDVRKIQENLNLKLICRDDRSLTFRIDKVGTSMMTATSQDQRRKYLPQDIYVIKVHRAKDVQEYSVYLSDDDFFTIGSLKHNTSHNITAVVVHASNEYSVIAKAQQHRTLRWGYTPGMVQDIQARSFHVDEANDMRVTAEITWKPSGDMTCCYDIICFAPESDDYDLTPLEIRDPHQLYTYNLVNLTFSSIYKIGIRAKNPNNIAKESELFWKTFEAPSCHEWYNYNFNICAPLQPVGLEVEQIILGDHEYSLNISWQQPEFYPDYYTLRVLDLTDDGKPYVLNISQIENSVVIPKIKLEGVMYEVHLTAYTPGGNSTAVTTDLTKMLVVVADKHHAVKLICFILLPIFCSGFLLLTTFIICHRRTKLKRYQERCRYFEDLEKKAPIDSKATYDFATKHLTLLHPSRLEEDLAQFQAETEEKAWLNDDVEIEKSDVTLYEVLGEGAFGVVRRGVYKDAKLGLREVAVKMLKSQPSVDDVRAFRREIEVMKSVEQHPNIVGIIGHCTKRVTEMWLLTEYCSFGNLLEFLRNEWKYLHELKFEAESNRLAADARKQQSIRVESNYKTTSKSRNNKRCEESKNNRNDNNGGSNSSSSSDVHSSTPSPSPASLSLPPPTPTSSPLSRNDLPTQLISANAAERIKATTTTTTTAADNKSYGYPEICTNACKCQVDVLLIQGDIHLRESNRKVKDVHEDTDIIATTTATTTLTTLTSPDSEQSKWATNHHPISAIQIKNCDCNQLLAHKNQQNTERMKLNGMSVDKAYYKFSTTSGNRRRKKDKCSATKPLTEETLVTASNGFPNMAKREPLKAGDLLDIAKQVAVGMEFLAKNKVVHRDLAARNVLVATDRTIKIADFGLSRDVYQENIYKKTGNGKLPIKWLALESMTHQVYTTQSDVWSYGILLYEIVTLGGTPYPAIPTNRLLHLLKSGYRMEKPKHCGQELYNLMYSCWNLNPAERPNFTQIIKTLEKLMGTAPENHIKSLLWSKAKRPQEASTDDAYLKPL